jgi:fused signal recognition particle receptor
MSAQVWIVLAVIAVAIVVLAIVLLRRSATSLEKPTDRPVAGGIRASNSDEAKSPGLLAPDLTDELAVPDYLPSTAEDRLSAAPADEDLDFGFEVPDSAVGRMHRLRARLSRSNNAIGKGLLGLLSRDNLDEQTWEEIEETLLAADLGVAPTMELLERLRAAVRVEGNASEERLTQLLREGLLELVDPDLDRSLVTKVDGRPAVVLVVGVNGTGKTTTTGKLARLLIAEDQTVLLGAADTFRAAAAEQLQTWGDRVGAPVVRGAEGADPAAVAFDAVATAIAAELDTAVIDTAGRLHTKTGLMDELGKVKRVIEKQSPVDEVLLVLDATTGQNGLVQARVFAEVVSVTGVVLTKLDGTARGGIVIAVQRELGVPVKLVGLGEGPDDLALFDPIEFVEAIING